MHGGETTRIVYNAMGQNVQEVMPNQCDPAMDIDSVTYNGNHGTRYTYYGNGMLENVTDAAGYITHYSSKYKDVKSASGVFIAQAGLSNYNYTNIENGFGEPKRKQTVAPNDYFRFYTHK